MTGFKSPRKGYALWQREQERNYYVALTRAKKSLYLVEPIPARGSNTTVGENIVTPVM